jgi:hypothetical protein
MLFSSNLMEHLSDDTARLLLCGLAAKPAEAQPGKRRGRPHHAEAEAAAGASEAAVQPAEAGAAESKA